MGNAFSYDLLHNRVVNATNIGISVLNQCSDTLESDFECQNCPNLLFNGISFDQTQTLNVKCLSNQTLINQIQNRINDYIITQANQDQTLGFANGDFAKYLTLNQQLSIIISQTLISLSRSFVEDQQLYCTSEGIKEFFATTLRLNNYLISNVPKVVESNSTFRDLITILSSTKVSQNKNRDFVIFTLVFIIIFGICIVLLLVGVSCGYIILLIFIIFIVSLIILKLTN